MAEEYEYLAQHRGFELVRRDDEIAEKDRTIARLQSELNSWKEMATIGYPDLMAAWMNAEVEKAVKAGRRSMRGELKRKGLLPEQVEKRLQEIMQS